MNKIEFIKNVQDVFKDFKNSKGSQADDEFYFESSGEDIEKIISEGLNHLAEYNPFGHILLDIQENFDCENHPHSIYDVRVINIL